jgi:hypothetical protein
MNGGAEVPCLFGIQLVGYKIQTTQKVLNTIHGAKVDKGRVGNIDFCHFPLKERIFSVYKL